MTKITHFTTVHSPLDVRIFYKECSSLSEAGYDVSLVAPKAAEGQMAGVLFISIEAESSRLRRMLFGPFRAMYAVLRSKPDICHFHDPELLLAGVALKLLGKKVIYDAHEDVIGQMNQREYIPPLFRRVIGLGFLLAKNLGTACFDAVVAATPEIALKFPPAKTVVVQNFPLVSEMLASGTVPLNFRPPHIAYIGGASRLRGFLDIVKAMGLIEGHSEARLQFAGTISPESLVQEAAALPGWERVTCHGWLSRTDTIRVLNNCRLGLVLYHTGPNHVRAQPNKLFEYMAAGIPVIASDFPLWREIIEESGCGLLVDPTDAQAIANAIGRLLDDPDLAMAMGQRGKKAVTNRYNWDAEATKLLKVYQELIA